MANILINNKSLQKCREIMQQSEAFNTRLKSLLEVNENENIKYPAKFHMLGFPLLTINSKEELRGRIEELKDLLNVEVVKDDI